MKYYGNSKEKENYITEIKKCRRNGQETYEVKFADGKVYKNIAVNERNLQRVIDIQEKQAKDNIEKLSQIYGKKLAWLTGAASSFIIGASVMVSPMINDLSGAAVVSAISLVGTFISCYKAKKYNDTQKEFEKIDYRNENKERLESYRDYPNALAGLPKAKQKYFQTENDPFCITKTDNFSKNDLETINNNIAREAKLGFTYVYVKKRNPQNVK